VNVWHLKNLILKFANRLLVFSLLASFLFAQVPSVHSGDSKLVEVTTGELDSAVSANVIEITVTATPHYVADLDKDWPKPSPVSVPVHVIGLVALILVISALYFSRKISRKLRYGLTFETKAQQERLA
jgi:hypothetical protein